MNLTVLKIAGNRLTGCVPAALRDRLSLDESDLGDLRFCR